jgi:nucleolar pre-ribosomal-associated protein 1
MTMAKRLAPEADPKFGQARVAKRQRVENSAERNGQRPNAVVEEVTSARRLQKALVFDQGSASGFRNGMRG